MIKFRCGNCNQKLGVQDEYAGRRIRCTRCSQICTVPDQAEPIEPAHDCDIPFREDLPVARYADDVETDEGELQLRDSGLDISHDLISGQLEKNILASPVTDHVPPRQKMEVPPDDNSFAETHKVGFYILCITTSLVFALVVAAISAVVIPVMTNISCCLTRFAVLGQIAIGWAAGLGAVLTTDRRNMRMVAIAFVMTVVGLLTCKCLIAKWFLIPGKARYIARTVELMDELERANDDRFVLTLMRARRQGYLWDLFACRELIDSGDMDEETYSMLVLHYAADQTPEALKPRLREFKRKARNKYLGWDFAKRIEIAKKHIPVVSKDVKAAVLKIEYTFAGAFADSINALWDLFCLAVAFFLAYRVASGSDDIPT